MATKDENSAEVEDTTSKKNIKVNDDITLPKHRVEKVKDSPTDDQTLKSIQDQLKAQDKSQAKPKDGSNLNTSTNYDFESDDDQYFAQLNRKDIHNDFMVNRVK